MTVMRHLVKISYILFFLVLVACEVKMPENIISPEKMEAVLYDYHMVQAMSSEYSSDEYKEKLFYDYVFAKHNVTKAGFDSSLVWYNRYPKHMVRIYSNLEERLTQEVDAFGQTNVALKEGVSLELAFLSADTAELWTSARTKMMLSSPLSNKLSFSFDAPADSAFVPGDSLVFSFNALFVNGGIPGLKQDAVASVSLTYDDGTDACSTVSVTESGSYAVAVERYDSRLKSMNGFLYYFDNDTTSSSRIVVTDISVKRMHPVVSDEKKK